MGGQVYYFGKNNYLSECVEYKSVEEGSFAHPRVSEQNNCTFCDIHCLSSGGGEPTSQAVSHRHGSTRVFVTIAHFSCYCLTSCYFVILTVQS